MTSLKTNLRPSSAIPSIVPTAERTQSIPIHNSHFHRPPSRGLPTNFSANIGLSSDNIQYSTTNESRTSLQSPEFFYRPNTNISSQHRLPNLRPETSTGSRFNQSHGSIAQNRGHRNGLENFPFVSDQQARYTNHVHTENGNHSRGSESMSLSISQSEWELEEHADYSPQSFNGPVAHAWRSPSHDMGHSLVSRADIPEMEKSIQYENGNKRVQLVPLENFLAQRPPNIENFRAVEDALSCTKFDTARAIQLLNARTQCNGSFNREASPLQSPQAHSLPVFVNRPDTVPINHPPMSATSPAALNYNGHPTISDHWGISLARPTTVFANSEAVYAHSQSMSSLPASTYHTLPANHKIGNDQYANLGSFQTQNRSRSRSKSRLNHSPTRNGAYIKGLICFPSFLLVLLLK